MLNIRGKRGAHNDASENIENNNRTSGEINSGPGSMHNMEGYLHWTSHKPEWKEL
jgi:hypothetical protein